MPPLAQKLRALDLLKKKKKEGEFRQALKLELTSPSPKLRALAVLRPKSLISASLVN